MLRVREVEPMAEKCPYGLIPLSMDCTVSLGAVFQISIEYEDCSPLSDRLKQAPREQFCDIIKAPQRIGLGFESPHKSL
jgi:hypothetical protein